MGSIFKKYKRLHLGDFYVLLELSSMQYRAGFKLGGHIFEKGIFSVLYKHKLPRIFIGFSKVLKYVNFRLYIGT